MNYGSSKNDKYTGKIGTEKRKGLKYELKLDLLGDVVKRARKEKNLRQEQSRKLIGVQ